MLNARETNSKNENIFTKSLSYLHVPNDTMILMLLYINCTAVASSYWLRNDMIGRDTVHVKSRVKAYKGLCNHWLSNQNIFLHRTSSLIPIQCEEKLTFISCFILPSVIDDIPMLKYIWQWSVLGRNDLIPGGFHKTFAANQKRTLTPPDTWSYPIWDLHLFLCWDHSFLNLSYPRTFWVSNIPRYFYFALNYLAKYIEFGKSLNTLF